MTCFVLKSSEHGLNGHEVHEEVIGSVEGNEYWDKNVGMRGKLVKLFYSS